MKTIVHGSTFSGIGGAEVAAAMLGWENAFHCEINPFGRKVLDYYFPNAESYEDITKTDFSKWGGQITILTGGFPCQPFSYAGQRRGTEDDRYLWPYMLKCIEDIKPTWFVGENVVGITTMAFPGDDVEMGNENYLFGTSDHYYEKRERYVLGEICSNLEHIGYEVQPFIIPACAVGAPHRRDRIFIVAHRIAEDTDCNGWRGKESEKSNGQGELRNSVSRDRKRICREEVAWTTPNTYGNGVSSGRSKEDEGKGREERIQERNSIQQFAEPVGVRFKMGKTSSDTDNKGLERKNESRSGEGRQRMCLWGTTAGCYTPDWARITEGLQSDHRWRNFPSVSPIYRGNDGFPFDVDNLTIPFAQWKKESLKAYGNAIVPQVLYEIFRCIDEIEQHNN